MVLVATFWKQWVMSILFCLSFWSMCCGDSDTHTHLKDRPSCIQDIPKTCSSSWSQGEKIGLCKIVSNRAGRLAKVLKIAWVHHFLSFAIISSHINNVLLYNATNVASKMCWALHIWAQFSAARSTHPPNPRRRLRWPCTRLPRRIHQQMRGTEVRVERSNRTLNAYCIIGYYKFWKVHCHILLVIVIYVCGFIVWSGIWWILANTIIII